MPGRQNGKAAKTVEGKARSLPPLPESAETSASMRCRGGTASTAYWNRAGSILLSRCRRPAAVPDKAVRTSCPEKLCVCAGCAWVWLWSESTPPLQHHARKRPHTGITSR